jgi:propanol-preferring alcohol dehydrogenase
MVPDAPRTRLRSLDLPKPDVDPARPGQVLLEVKACGVCRTDLHAADVEVEQTHAPLVLGHQIVGLRADMDPPASASASRGWAGPTAPARPAVIVP